ncbi:unnamed protein product [Lasius platythorax]|uniref:Uncharacterized protein n=1 Tax=Lasius platythorax TaxID=488582 RepID=A0AAV2NJC3_9HYME
MSHHATRIETTRASAHPSSSAAKALDPLCTRAKSIALTTHTVGCERKKDPAPGAAESVGVPKSRISSQSACCVNTDWTRPGVARSRLRPIFTDYSPCPPDREPVRGTAADDDFSVTRQLVLPVRCESSRGAPIRSTREWSHRNNALLGFPVDGLKTTMIEEIHRGTRGIELRDLETTRAPEGDSRSSKEETHPSISRVLESLR